MIEEILLVGIFCVAVFCAYVFIKKLTAVGSDISL